ncbi:MAG: hypothetical protein QMD77_01840 [Patescibacteria group bacterium]|nr:hypothetical protein [Patescibacteria group bacterium]
MKTNKSPAVILFAVFIFLTITYIIEEPFSFLAETLYLFPVFLAVLAGFFASEVYGPKSHNGKALALIAFGLAFWAAGELIWYIFKNFLNIDPFPSVADAFFLLAYPLFFAGILIGTRLAEIKWNRMNKSAIAAGITAIVILAAAVSYWGIYKVYDPETSPLENIIAMSYGVGDLILIGALIFSLGAARAFRGGRFGTLWTILTGGFFFFLVADIFFAIYQPIYIEGLKPCVYIDLVWIAGYLLITYGLLDNAFSIRSIQKKIK